MTTSLFDQGLRSVHTQASLSTYTFTLTFPAGEIAVLEVRGATSQEQARDLAEKALPLCRYSISDDDQSNRHVDAFYLWSSSVTQEGEARV